MNLHASAHVPERALPRCLAVAARAARTWAHDLPLVFGGDFNLRMPQRWRGCDRSPTRDVDHILIGRASYGSVGEAQTLDRGTLSDHLPLVVTLDDRPG